jgi:hypothetical protein
MQTYKRNAIHKQNQGQKPRHYINILRKILGKNSTSFHDKSSEETKNKRHIPQHYIVHSQHHIK